jgi:hypothetical protein
MGQGPANHGQRSATDHYGLRTIVAYCPLAQL